MWSISVSGTRPSGPKDDDQLCSHIIRHAVVFLESLCEESGSTVNLSSPGGELDLLVGKTDLVNPKEQGG